MLGWDDYTEGTRVLLLKAKDMATAMQDNFVGTEHILLAMAHPECDGVGQRILHSTGVTYDDIRERVALICD